MILYEKQRGFIFIRIEEIRDTSETDGNEILRTFDFFDYIEYPTSTNYKFVISIPYLCGFIV